MQMTAQQFDALLPDTVELLSDEPEMESSLHYTQLALLVSCLEWFWRDRQQFFIGANLTIYYSHQQLKNRDFRGPDFFLVKGTEQRPRTSWVVWNEEGRYPNLIIELLSNSTATVDRGLKKQLYQDRFRTLEYFWFSPETLEFAGFHLNADLVYAPIEPSPDGWLWSQELGLYLGIWHGQLRYFEQNGERVLTLPEAMAVQMTASEQVAQQAEADRQRAEAAERELQRLQAELRQLRGQ
ncbi:Uma2 family endonuclease [Prochlorothrix hollandica]|uniref:Putative restriction endonuclease domain-containing protein n=1 Tax=Prochlorothrix hollandica PCC 9006 = CALU 1027 TaxID=317619 RepID=A0A0M2PNK5_PROHO|nr:Uma2 family endonuclease [Prochlorothrix hollandica]KKI98195.1 hypothetical protein PROH_21205 [Prochlorothrix hollandica PCC 9006 = CALU 1027]